MDDDGGSNPIDQGFPRKPRTCAGRGLKSKRTVYRDNTKR